MESSIKHKAYAYSLVSNSFLVILSMCVKQLTAYYPVFLILGLRGVILFLLNYMIMAYYGLSFEAKDKKSFGLLIKRSVTSALTMTLFLSPMQFIPIGIATTLFNTVPLMTFFVEALYFQNTKIKWPHLFITFICFCGIILIIQPDFVTAEAKTTFFQYCLYIMVLLAALAGSFSVIYIHDLKEYKYSEYVILQYGYVFHQHFSFILYILFHDKFVSVQTTNKKIENPYDLFVFAVLMAGIAGSGFISQWTRIKSATYVKPSVVMPMQYISVLLGMSVDIFIFQEEYNFLTFIGAMMTSCGLLIKFIVD